MGGSKQNPMEVFKTAIDRIISEEVEYREKLDELHELQDISTSIDPSLNPALFDNFMKCLILCLSTPSNTIKATALRTIRFYCKDSNFICGMIRSNLTYFVAICLEKNKGTELERIQSLKLIKEIMTVNVNLMPVNLVQSLIAISKQLDDPLYFICLDTLNELAMLNPHIVAASNGFGTIISNIIDHSPFNDHFQESLTISATFLLDDFRTRQYLRHTEILTILSPLTDIHEQSQEVRTARWLASKTAIVKILKSWSGLITLASDPLALQKLVASLQLQNLELNDIMLDLLFGIFHLSIPKLSSNDKEISVFSPNYNMYDGDDRNKEIPVRIVNARHNLLDNYLAALLIAFNDAELLENLLKFCGRMNSVEETKNKEERRILAIKATCLVGELLNLSNHLLPPSQCARLQMLSPLVESAINYTQDPRLRSLAGTIVSNLHAYSHIKGTQTGTKDSRNEYFFDIKKKLEWKMDEPLLKQKMNDNVLLKKDYTQWNWEVIQELIEGPLGNPVHFNTPNTVKFVKKVLSFYSPSSQSFALLPCCRANEKYSKIGCQLLRLILSHDNGKQIISENAIITEFHDLLKDEYSRAESSKKDKDSIFSEEKVLKNMSRDYFLFIGVLSSNEIGVELLMKYKLFDQLVNIVQQSKRDDLCSLIVKNLDYSWDASPSRRLLGKALTAGSTIVKFLALKQMTTLLRAGIPDFYEWGIKLIVKQLDEGERIYKEALQILNEASNNPIYLDSIISRKPYESLVRMGTKGKELLLRFLSRSSGFKYLSTTPFVNEELLKWKEVEYITYVMSLESSLSDAFCSSVWKDKTGNKNSDTLVNLPPHLYGELAHTPDGCRLIQENGHFESFVNIILSPVTSNLEKRGALWVMGNIGKSRLGYKELLAKHDVLRLIIHLVKNSPSLSIKGTCFYILGLMSKAKCVAKALDILGWESQKETCITVPIDLMNSGLFFIPSWDVKVLLSDNLPSDISKQYNEEDPRSQVIKYIWDLSNHITTEKALNNLKRLKSQQPILFLDTELYFHCIKLLGNLNFQIRVRRFLHQIFAPIWKIDHINKLEASVPFEVPIDDSALPIPKFVPKQRTRTQSRDIRGDHRKQNSMDMDEIDTDSYPDEALVSPNHQLRSERSTSLSEVHPTGQSGQTTIWAREGLDRSGSQNRPRVVLFGSRNEAAQKQVSPTNQPHTNSNISGPPNQSAPMPPMRKPPQQPRPDPSNPNPHPNPNVPKVGFKPNPSGINPPKVSGPPIANPNPNPHRMGVNLNNSNSNNSNNSSNNNNNNPANRNIKSRPASQL